VQVVRVAIYARVSTSSDEQQNAIEGQIARLESKAEQLGDSNPRRYVDFETGTHDERPELQRLMADCHGGLLNVVVVTRLDRLSRNLIDGARLLRFFSRDDTPDLVATDESLDLTTPGGRTIAKVMIVFAEQESERIAERVRRGNDYRRKTRKPFGSKPLFAYRFTEDGNGLEPDPDRWHIAQQAVERFLKDPTTGSLVDWFWNEHGIKWGSNYSLQRWLRNPTIAGARVYGQQKKETDPETGRKRKISRSPGDFEKVIWTDDDGQPFQPPLISQLQQAFIHSVFQARSEPSQRNLKAGETRILTGLVTCGECGRKLHYHQPGKGAGYWCLRCVTVGCSRRYKTLRAAGTAEGMLTALQLHAKELLQHLAEVERAQSGQMSPEEKELRERIQQLEAMNDPDLQPVLDKKRDQLAVMLNQHDQGELESFLEAADALKELSVTDLVSDEPALVRDLLQRYVRAETGIGEIGLVYVAESIRRPGKDRFINISGMGVGKQPKQQIKATMQWLRDRAAQGSAQPQ